MDGLPVSLDAFGPAALAVTMLAGYLVIGEPVAGHVLHRRFEGRLSRDPAARRSFYRRVLGLGGGPGRVPPLRLAAPPPPPPGGPGGPWAAGRAAPPPRRARP